MQKGHEKQCCKVEDASQKSPEEAAAFHDLSCDKSSHKTGDYVDCIDPQVNLAFWQPETVEGEGQGYHEKAGNYVGDEQGTDHQPRL